MNSTTRKKTAAAATARRHTFKRANTKEQYMKRRTAKMKNIQSIKKEIRHETYRKKRESITFSNIQERTLSKKPPELVLFNFSHGIVSDMPFLDKGLYWYSPVPIEECLLFSDEEKDETNILRLAELYRQFPNQHHHILTNYCNYLNQTDKYDYKLVKNILSVMKSYLPVLMIAFVEAKKPDPILAKLNIIFERSRVSFEELDFANTTIMNYDNHINDVDMNELYRITLPIIELINQIYELFLSLTPHEQNHLQQFIPFNTHFDFFMNYMEKATQYVSQLPKYLTHKPAVRCGFKRLLKNKLFVYSEDVRMNGLYVISAAAVAPQIQPFLIPSAVRGISKINIAHLKRQIGSGGGGDGSAILVNELCNALHSLGYGNIALYDYSCNSTTEEDYAKKIANYERNSFIRDITPATASRAI